MPYYKFFWTELRLEKLRQNGVDPDDVEAIISQPAYEDRSRSSGRTIAFGTDDAGDEIACIYEMKSIVTDARFSQSQRFTRVGSDAATYIE